MDSEGNGMKSKGAAAAHMLQSAVAQQGINDRNFKLGIVRLSTTREVVFINHAAHEIMGTAIRLGMDICDLPLDGGSRTRMRNAMRRRFNEQRGQSYRVRFKRPDLKTWVRVLISAVPEYGPDGACTGSIGYILDETLDSAILAIHKEIADARQCHALLRAVTDQLREVMGFDTLGVVGISDERNHLVQIFEDPPPPAFVSPTKWWPMPKFAKQMIDGRETGPLDLEEMFATPAFRKYEAREPDARRFRERGFRHCLRLGVYREKKLVAMLSLLRKADIRFTDKDLHRLEKLPLNEAVLAAMNFAQRDELEFSASFVQKIACVADNTEAVAQVLVSELARHYLWSHVSLFRLDEDKAAFRLVCQADGCPNRLPDCYCQPTSVGFLGEAHRSKKSINIGDVKHARWIGRYHPLLESTRSEMVLPVPGTDGRWLLNVESDLRESFANAEQESVEIQLQIAGFILERTASLELKTAIFTSVDDAVIRTNDLFVIVEANPAAERLLGRKNGELMNAHLGELIEFDHAHVAHVAQEQHNEEFCSKTSVSAALTRIVEKEEQTQVRFKCADGQLIPVLLSAAPLPERLGGKVFVAGDLREQQRIQRMEVLNNVFHQLASELRVPLALSEAFLEEAMEHSSDDAHDLIDKTLRQIRKADMPLERMVRLAVRDQGGTLPRTNFDLREALGRMIEEFPEHEAKDIEFHAQDAHFLVHAPRHELLFCVRSVLAYLMRRKAQVEAVDIVLDSSGKDAVIGLAIGRKGSGQKQGASQLTTSADNAPESDHELALAEPVIKSLMDRMGGQYLAHGGRHGHFQLRFNAE
jgi:PAS domain S-box-containing protein